MFYTYLLKLNNGDIYVGSTSDLKRRIEEHNIGKSPHTKKFRPIKLVQYSAFLTKKKALNFEHYLKSGSGIAFRTRRLL